jgi:dihydrofolate reductase
MPNHVFIATSLDGYIATTDGGLDWLDVPNPDQSDFGYGEFISGVDAIVMGRRTFEKVMTFGSWPYEKPVFVLSNTITNVPEPVKEKVELLGGDVRTVIKELKVRGYANLYIDGGRVIQSFLREDLIDELILTRIPVLLGGGIPLFGQLDTELNLKHRKTETFGNGLVISRYYRDRR